jgi:hypothetical protein
VNDAIGVGEWFLLATRSVSVNPAARVTPAAHASAAISEAAVVLRARVDDVIMEGLLADFTNVSGS